MPTIATDSQKRLWALISAVPVALNLGVGPRNAQAHLFGSFDVQYRDEDDLVVLRGQETHVHVDWKAITEVVQTDRYGWDCIRFMGEEGKLLDLWPEDETYRYPNVLIDSLHLGAWPK